MVEHIVSLVVRRSSSGLVVMCKDSDGCSMTPSRPINLNLVHRSKFLQHVHDALKDDEEENVGMQISWMNTWLDYVLSSEAADTAPTAMLITALQAADFLADQQSVDTISDLLASQLLNGSQMDFGSGFRRSQPWFSVVNALQDLREELTLRVLRAAMTVKSTCDLFMSIGNPRHPHCCLSTSACALSSLLTCLPEALWAPALTAACPSVDNGALRLEGLSTETISSIITAAASVPHLTSLTLQFSDFSTNTWLSSLAVQVLPTFSTLVALKLEGASRAIVTCWLREMPAMPQLTTLSLRDSDMPWKSYQSSGNFWAGLHGLLALRTLDVSRGDLKESPAGIAVPTSSRDGKNKQFLQFVECLSRLTALEEFFFRGHCIGSDGWRRLAAAVANLPLRLLDLSWCLSRSEPTARGVEPIELHSVAASTCAGACTSLSIGGCASTCGDRFAQELQVCTQLRELHLQCFESDGKFWRALQAAPLALESFGFDGRFPLQADEPGTALRFIASQTDLRRLNIRLMKDFRDPLQLSDAVIARALAAALAGLTALHDLRLDCDFNCQVFAATNAQRTMLTCLHLHRFHLGSETSQCEELVAGVLKLTALKELKVHDVSGGHAAHCALAAVIGCLVTLTHLELHHGGFEQTNLGGQRQLADIYAASLRNLCCLEILHFERPKSQLVEQECAAAWATGVAGMSQLKTLILRHVETVGAAAASLAEALSNMPKLQTIGVICGGDADAAATIASSLPRGVINVDFGLACAKIPGHRRL